MGSCWDAAAGAARATTSDLACPPALPRPPALHADWLTFYPMRLILFPVLLPYFWKEMMVSLQEPPCCCCRSPASSQGQQRQPPLLPPPTEQRLQPLGGDGGDGHTALKDTNQIPLSHLTPHPSITAERRLQPLGDGGRDGHAGGALRLQRVLSGCLLVPHTLAPVSGAIWAGWRPFMGLHPQPHGFARASASCRWDENIAPPGTPLL